MNDFFLLFCFLTVERREARSHFCSENGFHFLLVSLGRILSYFPCNFASQSSCFQVLLCDHQLSKLNVNTNTHFVFVLLGFTGFYLVLTGFYWVLLSFTGFYWVLQGFTGFYLVLLGLTGFDSV